MDVSLRIFCCKSIKEIIRIEHLRDTFVNSAFTPFNDGGRGGEDDVFFIYFEIQQFFLYMILYFENLSFKILINKQSCWCVIKTL